MQKLLFIIRGVLLSVVLVSCLLVSVPAYAVTCPNMQVCNGGCIGLNDLCILERLPGGPASISADDIAQLGALRAYLSSGPWKWAFGTGIAIAVLNGVVGGLMIVLSNGDSSQIESGKSRFMWSALGLVLLLLSGVILQFLNPTGFLNL